MVTITINERTKAGKALLATAQLLAEHSKGIQFSNTETLLEVPNPTTLLAINETKSGKLKKNNSLGELMKELRS